MNIASNNEEIKCKPRKAKHGTRSMYVMGCYCDDCKSANRDYMRKIKSKLKGTEPKKHGTLSSYTDYGCRCDGCREASREYDRAYRAL